MEDKERRREVKNELAEFFLLLFLSLSLAAQNRCNSRVYIEASLSLCVCMLYSCLSLTHFLIKIGTKQGCGKFGIFFKKKKGSSFEKQKLYERACAESCVREELFFLCLYGGGDVSVAQSINLFQAFFQTSSSRRCLDEPADEEETTGNIGRCCFP